MIPLKCRYIVLCIISLFALEGRAQIITSLDSLPLIEAKGVLSSFDDTDTSPQSEFQSWDNTLSAFHSENKVTDNDIKLKMKGNRLISNDINKVFLDGKELNLPANIDENGVDLYMLTDEGISI